MSAEFVLKDPEQERSPHGELVRYTVVEIVGINGHGSPL